MRQWQKGEQKIAPFASRRRYDCKRLQIPGRDATEDFAVC
jgi:hypothetical protein